MLTKRIDTSHAKQGDRLPDSLPDSLTNVEIIRALYCVNLEWLFCNKRKEAGELEPALAILLKHQADTASKFYADPGLRTPGDATDASLFSANSFDVVTSVWVLNYLDKTSQARVIKNAITWVKPGGQLRINAGTRSAEGSKAGKIEPEEFSSMFDIGGIDSNGRFYVDHRSKRAIVNTDSSDGLLVVNVVSIPGH